MTGSSKQNEPPANFETADDFSTLIAEIRSSATVQPSGSFTDHVMARLSDPMQTKPSLERFNAATAFNLIRQKYWPKVIKSTDCALCFVLSGFFYLIISITLTIGLKPLSSTLAPGSWLALQPIVTFCFAVILAIIGILIFINRQFTHRLARLGAMGYLLFSLVNGLLSHWLPGTPLKPAGLVFYTIGATLLGIFLWVTLQKSRSHESLQICEPQCRQGG